MSRQGKLSQFCCEPLIPQAWDDVADAIGSGSSPVILFKKILNFSSDLTKYLIQNYYKGSI